MLKSDKMGFNKDSVNMGFHLRNMDHALMYMKGKFIIELFDENGEITDKRELDNLITYDAGILAARLFKNPTEPNFGFNMLAVGTGATGAILSPDAPDRRQRKLNSEIERKAFSSTVFRDVGGVAVAIPTNIVDYTVTYGPTEAVGPLNEMGVMSTLSANPAVQNLNPDNFPARDLTLDITNYDILGNYLTFAVVSKPLGSSLAITWRITFG